MDGRRPGLPYRRIRSLVLWWSISLLMVVGGFSHGDTSVATLAEALGLRLEWDPFRRIGVLHDGVDRLLFDPDRGTVVYNHTSVVAPDGVAYKDGTVVVSEKTEAFVRAHFARDVGLIGGRVAAIVLDPGHGGRDPGANHTQTIDGEDVYLVEKDIVLSVAQDLFERLKSRYPDRTLVITRDEDVYLKLEERVAIANEIEIDPEREIMLFVSIHANASLNAKTYGYEVWYLPTEYSRTDLVSTDEVGKAATDVLPILNLMRDEEFSNESVRLAQSILDGFDGTVGDVSRNLGLKEEVWFVVRNAKMPSVLVELGYLTNQYEAGLFHDEAYLRKLTQGLYNGITDFVDDFEARYRDLGGL